jgi:RNA polymerase sigma-70 factor (ECF subfamily)
MDKLDRGLLHGIPEGNPLPPSEDRVPSFPRSTDLDVIYRTNKPRLLRWFRRRGSTVDADDLVQETFARLAAVLQPVLPAIQNSERYITRIADNLLRDQARTRKSRSAADHLPFDEVEERELPSFDQQNSLEARDMLDRLEQAMLKLKPRTREIFMAHRLDGFTYREIAARTGLGIKCVEKHMSRAIAHIDRVMSTR